MTKNHTIQQAVNQSNFLGLLRDRKFKLLFATIITLSLFTAGNAQTLDKTKLDQFFDRLAEKNKAMGSLNITKDGKVLYSRAIGYSQINGREKKPLTAATRYRIGSITKMFTAAMIFQLIEEGKLKLTDRIDEFFPQIPNAEKITIAHVLAHRSGIHELTEDKDFRTLRFKSITKDEFVGYMAKAPSDFEPGSKYSYSSSGYVLLGILIEKLTGNSYQENLEKKINSKIGLKDTYLGTGNIDMNKNESFSFKYARDWEQQPETNMSILFGSGALISTSGDMAKFIQALFDGKIVSKESLDQMMQNKFGMTTFTHNGKTVYGHTGGIDGFGAWLVYLPEEKLAVSYATNGKVYSVESIVDGVFDIYWNKPFQIPAFESIAISTEILDKYVGVYSSPDAPVIFTVTREGTTLLVQMTGQTVIPLEPTAENKFKIDPPGIVMEFDPANKKMTIIRNGRERVLNKE